MNKALQCPACTSQTVRSKFSVPGGNVSQCNQCSHSFSHDIRIREEEIYNEEYFKEIHKGWFKHPNYPLFKKIESMCLEHLTHRDASILDVGCGNGDFLRYLSGQGFSDLTGIDFIKNQEQPGIKFIQGDIFQTSDDFFRKRFDLVVALATIEHVADIVQFIEILKSLTKVNGYICVMTVDEDSLLYRAARFLEKIGLSHGINRLYDIHHLNHFSRKSLSFLVEQNKNLKITEHFGSNFPVKAIDLPSSPFNFILKPLVSTIFHCTTKLKYGEFLQVMLIKRVL